MDSFFMRPGAVVQAGVVYAGEGVSMAVPGFAALNLVLVGAWLSVVAIINANLSRKAAADKTAAL